MKVVLSKEEVFRLAYAALAAQLGLGVDSKLVNVDWHIDTDDESGIGGLVFEIKPRHKGQKEGAR